MTGSSCEAIRDLLADRVDGRLAERACVQVDDHLTSCVDCRAERDLLRTILDARPAVPLGLESRVRAAVQPRRARRRLGPARLAVAATVVFAALLAAVMLAPGGILDRNTPVDDADVAATTTGTRSPNSDPLLHGGPGLGTLSVDELEALLAELDS